MTRSIVDWGVRRIARTNFMEQMATMGRQTTEKQTYRCLLEFLTANQVDGMGMCLDIRNSFHSQNPGLEGITGVVAVFNSSTAWLAVSHRIAFLTVHGSKDGLT